MLCQLEKVSFLIVKIDQQDKYHLVQKQLF